jgi:hypothetical protein
VLEEPLSDTEFRRLIRNILEYGTLLFSRHARQRMKEREMTEQDCRNVLWAGLLDDCIFENRSWRYRVRTGTMLVTVAFRNEERAVVVTVWREP